MDFENAFGAQQQEPPSSSSQTAKGGSFPVHSGQAQGHSDQDLFGRSLGENHLEGGSAAGTDNASPNDTFALYAQVLRKNKGKNGTRGFSA